MQDKKRALLFANGLLEQADWLKNYMLPGDFLVAVDGGYQHLKRLGLSPNLIIGDLDSLSQQDQEEIRLEGIEIHQFPPAKDQTDLELALETAAQRGFQSIRVMAALGGRLDQLLANIFLLTHPKLMGMDVRIENGAEEAFLIRESGTIEGQAGDTVSLLPLGLTAHGVTTQGLAYPLHGERLFSHHSRGISNVLLESTARVSLQSGTLLCVHLRKTVDSGDD